MKTKKQISHSIKIKKLFLSVLAVSLLMTFSCSNSTDKTKPQDTSDSMRNAKQGITADKMPEFPGGEKAMTKFIVDNVTYPEAAKKSGTQAKVFVTFVVTKTGKIDNVMVKEKGNELLDNEAIRVVSSMPDWIPGENKGVAVDVEMTLPISFKLQ
jgi:TonB family protein